MVCKRKKVEVGHPQTVEDINDVAVGGNKSAVGNESAVALALVVDDDRWMDSRSPVVYENLRYVVLYFLHCFLPKQEGYWSEDLQESVELPPYIEELFALIKESLRFSMGTNAIGFFAAFLGICAAILRSTSFLKIVIYTS